MLKFFYNGIKASDGKLQKCSYSKGYSHDPQAITIYARNYNRFCKEIRAQFTVENNTDSMTDYFEEDRIRVNADHPLYAQVAAAEAQKAARWEKRMAARTMRQAQRRVLLSQMVAGRA